MSKQALLIMLILTTFTLISCREQDTGFVSPSSKGDGKTFPQPPAERQTPLPPPYTIEQIPVFQVSPDWQISQTQPELLRLPQQKGSPITLRLQSVNKLRADLSVQSQLKKHRDQLYAEHFCQPGTEEKSFSNCEKGFQKSTQTIGQYNAEILQEYGTWEDLNRPVYHLFISDAKGTIKVDSNIYQEFYFLVEGDLEKAKPAIVQIISTLKWETRLIPEVTSQIEEKGL